MLSLSEIKFLFGIRKCFPLAKEDLGFFLLVLIQILTVDHNEYFYNMPTNITSSTNKFAKVFKKPHWPQFHRVAEKWRWDCVKADVCLLWSVSTWANLVTLSFSTSYVKLHMKRILNIISPVCLRETQWWKNLNSLLLSSLNSIYYTL